MNLNKLTTEIEDAIDYNDNYTPLILLSEYVKLDEEDVNEIKRLEARHQRIGYLTSDVRVERDAYRENLKQVIISDPKYGMKFWAQFHI